MTDQPGLEPAAGRQTFDAPPEAAAAPSAGPLPFRIEVEEVPARRFRYVRFFSLASGFWQGESRRIAWWLTIALIVSVLCNIGLQYALNLWNKTFFDAIGAKDVATIQNSIGLFALIAGSAILAMAGQVFLRMSMQARWRRWLTTHLSTEWLRDRQFYKMNVAAPEIDSPEFRMTDDVRAGIDPIVDFAIGLSNAILMAAVFAVVLWSVGGGITVFGFTIPGYFVWAAALYGLIASLLTTWIGRPLIDSTEAKNAAEAQSRYELVRVRENAENIALIGGADDEREKFRQTLALVLERWRHVIRQQSLITLIIHGNTMLSPVLPLLIGAPKYLSGELSLGELMQISAAFLQVQLAFNWLVENFFRLAEWSASARRIVELSGTLRGFSSPDAATQEIVVSEGPDARLKLVNLSVSLHDGRIVIRDAEFVIEPGEKILIRGQSGTGKSTLIRAIAGLWPWGRGQIIMPKQSRVMFVPQRPYIPNGSLRAALAYPENDIHHTDEAMRAALERCGLRHLGRELDHEETWDKVLSGGEQQRLAFARLVLHRPEVIVLDEATSALDEDSQDIVMGLFQAELGYATLLSVGHRPNLEEYHDRIIELSRRPSGAHVSEGKSPVHQVGGILKRLIRPVPKEAAS